MGTRSRTLCESLQPEESPENSWEFSGCILHRSVGRTCFLGTGNLRATWFAFRLRDGQSFAWHLRTVREIKLFPGAHTQIQPYGSLKIVICNSDVLFGSFRGRSALNAFYGQSWLTLRRTGCRAWL